MSGPKKVVVVSQSYSPTHEITECSECPSFVNRGGSWGEYHHCVELDSDINFTAEHTAFPSNCPLMQSPPPPRDPYEEICKGIALVVKRELRDVRGQAREEIIDKLGEQFRFFDL